MRIWKCDTKWGGSSILEIFADFRIAFFGTDAARIGHHWDVRPGDQLVYHREPELLQLPKR